MIRALPFMSILLFCSINYSHAAITVKYANNIDLSHKNKTINMTLQNGYVLEKISQELETVFNTPPLELVTAECGFINAFYQSGINRITLCLEMVEETVNRSVQVASKQNAKYLAGGALRLIIAHELGHALISQYALPTLGREEDVADQIATYALLSSQGAKWGISAATLVMNGNDTNMADVHSLDTQRRINMVCLALGKDQEKFSFAKKVVPKQRHEYCSYEYQRMASALKKLLGENLKV